MQKTELKGLVRQALVQAGTAVVDRTPASQTDYFDYDIRHAALPGGQLKARFFIWELTQDRSAGGRPPGEHKLQLTIGHRSDVTHNFPSTARRHNFLLGYSQKYGLLIGFQIELHKNFGWSKLVACHDDALVHAKSHGWAAHLRHASPKTGQQELAIAFKPSHIVDWLCFQLDHSEVYGEVRRSEANAWLAKARQAAGAAVEAINMNTVPPATAQDVAQDTETLSAIAGDIQIAAGAATATVQVNIAERIAATNRHNALLLAVNNHVHAVFGRNAFVVDRDLPGHRRTYAGATVQPDLGVRVAKRGADKYVIVEAKSLPADIGGQWRQVIIAVGELARYSMVYKERFNAWPTRVLGLEHLPGDEDLQRFLRDLRDNEDISVIWREGDVFQTFRSHHDAISWLASAVD